MICYYICLVIFKCNFLVYIFYKLKCYSGTISSLLKFLSMQDSVVVGSLSQDSTTGANSESG